MFNRISSWFQRHPPALTEATLPRDGRGVTDHIIILDGTLSSLKPGHETNAGILFKLLCENGPVAARTVFYEPGVQWEDWGHLIDVAQGRGINRQIMRAYGYLASHYRAGDRIFLIGYSRGAFAVRSLAGVIDMVGLVRRQFATERNVQLAYRHYRRDPARSSARAFARRFCHEKVRIEAVCVWDTVKALGIRLPLLWMLTEKQHSFHNHDIGASVCNGFHALALHETRVVFTPIMWTTPPDWSGHLEQVWFRGAHADIGGQIGVSRHSRPLANVSLVWMLRRLERCGLDLPEGWADRYVCDPHAPMVGTWRGWGALFLLRRRREVGADPSESLHPTALMGKQHWLRRGPKLAAALNGRGVKQFTGSE